MPRVWKPLAAAATLTAVLLFVAVLAADRAVAQEPAGTSAADSAGTAVAATTAATPAPADTTLAKVRSKHPHFFAVSARGGWRVPVHVLKLNQRNINDITAASGGFDAGLRCYPLDGLAVGFRYARGGLDMTTKPLDLARFSLTGKEYIRLDSYSIWLSAYLGTALMPDSRFNPYLTVSVSRFDWAFSQDGRDGPTYIILETPVEGKNTGLAGGIGCEYALSRRLWVETEWSWNYALTELSRTDGVFGEWTNTQYWNLGLGLVLGF